MEVHWSLPIAHLLQPNFLRTELVVPDDDDFLHFWAVHVGIAVDVLENALEVLFGIEGGSDESEPAVLADVTFEGWSSRTPRRSNRRK